MRNIPVRPSSKTAYCSCPLRIPESVCSLNVLQAQLVAQQCVDGLDVGKESTSDRAGYAGLVNLERLDLQPKLMT